MQKGIRSKYLKENSLDSQARSYSSHGIMKIKAKSWILNCSEFCVDYLISQESNFIYKALSLPNHFIQWHLLFLLLNDSLSITGHCFLQWAKTIDTFHLLSSSLNWKRNSLWFKWKREDGKHFVQFLCHNRIWQFFGAGQHKNWISPNLSLFVCILHV